MSHPSESVILGLWPIAGITTIGVTPDDAKATIAAAIESGIYQFDTAYSYGFDGESDRVLGQFLKGRRDHFKVIGKVGQRWTADRQRIVNGSPEQLTMDAEESLRRMGSEYFDTLLLHSPDPQVPIEESASALTKLRDRGLCRRIGISNFDTDQLLAFNKVADCQAIQCPLNMLQTANLVSLIPTCREFEMDVWVFWALMKGLLAGKIGRDHQFADGDSRPKYEIFQGQQREQAHGLLDELRTIGNNAEIGLPALTIGWTLSQPGVTAALVGARYPDQIRETARARPLPADILARVESARKQYENPPSEA